MDPLVVYLYVVYWSNNRCIKYVQYVQYIELAPPPVDPDMGFNIGYITLQVPPNPL